MLATQIAEKLSDYFENFGEVVDVVVMTNLETGRSRGFGFVEFKDPASVRNVLSKSQHQLDGRNVRVCLDRSSSEHGSMS